MLLLGWAIGPIKILVGVVLASGLLLLIFIRFPGAVVREFTRPENERLPQWMGDVKSRRARLWILIGAIAWMLIMAALITILF